MKTNTLEVEPYIDRHMDYLKNQHPAQRQAWLEKEHSKMFGQWLRDEVERELAVSDAYDDVDEEFSTVILPQNDNIMPRVDPLDLGKESRDDYFRTDCRDDQRSDLLLQNFDDDPELSAKYLIMQEARFSNGEAYTTDLSLITKARYNGQNYVFALLTGYHDPPADVTIKEYGTPTIEAQSRDGKPLDQTS
ncbi:hypothetical protein L6452_37103 [Arctium lappa]|uniref:Uncharacterized protein n=1 Tax=Arctium lappa TaxID=4217 RepID=A0ACB8Y3L4_ARCLA|nr:hypothetical protein L6452_37103 [Arctium lappa]